MKIVVCIFVSLLVLADCENPEEIELKGIKTSLLKTMLKMLKGYSTKLDTVQKQQNQLTSEMSSLKQSIARRRINVDKQLIALRTAQKCQSGRVVKATTKYPYRYYIRFNPPFPKTPSFVFGTTLLDTIWNKNLRAVASASHLTGTGVTIGLNKWADTFMYAMGINWMACPK